MPLQSYQFEKKLHCLTDMTFGSVSYMTASTNSTFKIQYFAMAFIKFSFGWGFGTGLTAK
uniref:Uncharacterized protein n=1 Tax=Arundo donax TaxID=35708 RepID=A0A0A9GQP4_ARUDO